MTENAAAGPARDHDLVSVQCLRGIAALMVVCSHCFPQLERMGYTGNKFVSLSSGVDIFFIISGFIMLVSARRSPSRGAGAFLLNRVIRIIPIYWMMTSVIVTFALFAPQLLGSTKFELTHVIKSYLMIPATHPVLNGYWPILVPGWTLNYEMFFYCIFALGLMLVPDRGQRLSIFVGTVIAAIAVLPTLVPLEGISAFYTSNVVLEFVFGIIAAELYIAGYRISRRLGGICITLGFGLLLLSDYVTYPDVRGLTFGIPALMVFAGFVFAPWTMKGKITTFLRPAGDASYSIYLTHMITMSAIGQGWRRFLGSAIPGNTILFVVVATTVCGVVGYLFYVMVEHRLTDRLKTATRRKSPPIVPASV